MVFDYLIAILLFSGNEVNFQVIQLTPEKRLEQRLFVDKATESANLIAALQKLSKQSKKFRVCMVQKNYDFESPLEGAIQSLLLKKSDEFPAIVTSFSNVNKYIGADESAVVSSQEALSYCFGTIPKALP